MENLSEGIANIFRAAARPVITIIFTAALVDMVVSGITPPVWFLSIAIPTITWWFGERAVTHYKNNKNNLAFVTKLGKITWEM